MDVHIRAALPSDAEAASSLLSQLGYPTPPGAAAERLERTQGGVLVAEVDGAVVGMAAFHVIPHLEVDHPTARLTSLVVHDEARRQGIGRQLVERVVEEARNAGCGRIELMSGDQRDDAHAFYRRLGFTDFSRRFVRELD